MTANTLRRLGVAAPVLALLASCAATDDAAASRPVAYLDRTPSEWIADFRLPEQSKREAAVDALAKLGPDMAPLVAAELDDHDADVRYAALATLARYDAAALPAAERVALRVEDPHPAVRAEAAFVLMKSGEGAAAAGTAPLARVVRSDEDWYVRLRAVEALGAFKGSAYPVGYESLRAIEHQDRDVRVREAATLAADEIWRVYWQRQLHGGR